MRNFNTKAAEGAAKSTAFAENINQVSSALETIANRTTDIDRQYAAITAQVVGLAAYLTDNPLEAEQMFGKRAASKGWSAQVKKGAVHLLGDKSRGIAAKIAVVAQSLAARTAAEAKVEIAALGGFAEALRKARNTRKANKTNVEDDGTVVMVTLPGGATGAMSLSAKQLRRLQARVQWGTGTAVMPTPSNDNGEGAEPPPSGTSSQPPIYEEGWALSYLQTLMKHGRFEDRQALLRGELTASTKNGDVCLTADPIWKAPLEALGRSHYDLDAASPDTPYPQKTGAKSKWTYSPIAATHRLTVEAGTFGGLDRTWNGVIWCNPPYGLHSWATFCEKARFEVKRGNADLVVCLVPATQGNISAHVTEEIWDENAYEITFIRTLPFWMTESGGEATIAGSRFIIYGKAEMMRDFIPKLADELLNLGVIGEKLCAHHHQRAARIFAPHGVGDLDLAA